MAQRNLLEKILKAGRQQFPSLFVLSFLTNLLLLVSSIYMLQVFDRVLASGSIDTLIWLTIIAVLAILSYGFLEFARRKILSRNSTWIVENLSPEILRRNVSARLKVGRSPASLGDVRDLRNFVGGDAILAFFDAPWSPVFIAIIWLMHPILGVIAVTGAVVLLTIGILNDVITRRPMAQSNAHMRQVYGDAEAFVHNADVLEGMGMTETVAQRWRQRYGEAEREGAGAVEAALILYNMSRSIRLGFQIAILGAGAALVLRAELTAGGMIAASIILARALSPVERAISAWKGFGSYRLAKAKLAHLFRITDAPADRISLEKPKGRLSARELRYLAPETQEALIKTVTFQLSPGQICAVLGPSGSGKSSLCRLLVGAWKPSFGEVRLDGADMQEWPSEERGRYVGFLPQDVDLFSGTIAENIARMGPVIDEKVLAAAQKSGAHDMILSLPEGYETQLGLYSDQLSGGQKQRIGLARALYGDPSLLVLDEPSSNLDGNGEIALQKALQLMKAAAQTVVVVTHVPSLLKQADKIAVVNAGTMIKFGDRDEILKDMIPKDRVPHQKPHAAE
ncbi:type I secretion system permease/ATPase [Cognatishimia maritima]|uniref:ATP-binding cassette, subfamily C n=1 Tax=Cognatishimia maritima TaxID=870908 RepID=A0A1M5TEQ0_9RHOB|nr:type I secretion system permease/ATPase [Cognatishimia maritima]SHH49120.1 ATP-binding cassette, subfamily C [Cognatishimia maritima]